MNDEKIPEKDVPFIPAEESAEPKQQVSVGLVVPPVSAVPAMLTAVS